MSIKYTWSFVAPSEICYYVKYETAASIYIYVIK